MRAARHSVAVMLAICLNGAAVADWRPLLSTGDEDPAETTAALTHASPYLRKRIAQDLELRFTPDLEFFFDEQLAGARRIDSLLRSLHEDPAD